MADRRRLIKRDHESLSLKRQCELLSLNRSSFYYVPQGESEENLWLMRKIDELYIAHPFYGSRRIRTALGRQGISVGRDRVRRLMRVMGIEGKLPGRRTTRSAPGHKIYPNVLKGLSVERAGQVWCSDITYVPMHKGTMYLTVIMDWYSRAVLSWQLSNTLDSDFCVQALQAALERYGKPDVFHSDQGCQYTSGAFTSVLKSHQITISMSGRGRAYDNIFVERFWRSLKYEEVYKHEYNTVRELREAVSGYMRFYNVCRPHQALGDKTPWDVYTGLDPVPTPPILSRQRWRAQPAFSAPPTSSTSHSRSGRSSRAPGVQGST